jgi:hypothetical protein
MWDLWWTKRQWSMFSLSISVFLANQSTDGTTPIITYQPGLVQYVTEWPTYQVDSSLAAPSGIQKKIHYVISCHSLYQNAIQHTFQAEDIE